MYKKFVIYGIAVFLVGFVIFGLFSVSKSSKTSLNIDTVPSSVRVTIDGKAARTGINKVSPGTHTVIVTKTGFAEFKQDVAVDTSTTQYVGVVLLPNTEATKNWYNEHPEDAKKAERITGKSLDQNASNSLKQQKLITELPFEAAGGTFRIDYGAPPNGADNSVKQTIYITAQSDSAVADAKQWITSGGYKLEDYTIVIRNTSIGD